MVILRKYLIKPRRTASHLLISSLTLTPSLKRIKELIQLYLLFRTSKISQKILKNLMSYMQRFQILWVSVNIQNLKPWMKISLNLNRHSKNINTFQIIQRISCIRRTRQSCCTILKNSSRIILTKKTEKYIIDWNSVPLEIIVKLLIINQDGWVRCWNFN